MADSRRKAIIKAAVAALDAPGKPGGLRVHQFRTRPIDRDTLPALAVYLRTEASELMGERSYAVKRELQFTVECRVQGTEPDDALDPLLQWVVSQLMVDQTLGGTCKHLEEVSTEWDADGADKVYGAAAVTFRATYHTRAADLTQF